MLKKIKNLYLKYKEIINYLIVGGLTTVVSLGSYYLFTIIFLDPEDAIQLQIANCLSWVCAVTFAYFANRKYVFESHEKNIFKEMVSFFGARVGTLLIEMAILFIIVTCLGLNDRIGKIVTQVVVTILNYVFSKLFVFRKKRKEEKP